MVDRDEGRSLAARAHVGRAKVVNDRNTQLARERGTVADLNRQTRLRPVQYRLPVKADDVDFAAFDSMLAKERLDCLKMRGGNEALGITYGARSFVTTCDPRGGLHCGPQKLPLLFGIRPITDRSKTRDRLAVGLDQCDVHPVERGPAHQSDRRQRAHGWPGFPLNRTGDLLHQRPGRCDGSGRSRKRFP